jgi:hypothetical protein
MHLGQVPVEKALRLELALALRAGLQPLWRGAAFWGSGGLRLPDLSLPIRLKRWPLAVHLRAEFHAERQGIGERALDVP